MRVRAAVGLDQSVDAEIAVVGLVAEIAAVGEERSAATQRKRLVPEPWSESSVQLSRLVAACLRVRRLPLAPGPGE